jgi:hypothetical protein
VGEGSGTAWFRMLVENDKSSSKECESFYCCPKQARNIVGEVKAFGACRRQQMFWLIAKVMYTLSLIFEGGVLCVKS